ncbi:glutamate--cysteine ligase [Lentzea alba]|uniref:carboxylate-amine ligase n=1 Tax=Lentzea alba TaxID=2714351 RepID=UPI0039BF7E8E
MSTALTFGIEEEYLVLDAATRRPSPVGARAVTRLSDVDFHREFSAAQAEFATPVCLDLAAAGKELTRGRTTLAEAARDHGALIIASGTPPLGRPGPPPVTDKPRYRRMAERFGMLTEDQGVCGCHVHVGVPDVDEAIRVSNHIRPWLPALLLLAANSPFFNGRDTRYASWRTVVWSRWPVVGVPPHFRDVREYHELVGRLVDAEVVTDAGMIYWFVRPSRHVPTVEVRVADVAMTVPEALLQAALTRALVSVALESERQPCVSDVLLRTACAQAALVGPDGRCLDPFSGKASEGWNLVDDLVRHVSPALRAAGDLGFVQGQMSWLRAHGGGAARQRRVLRERGELSAVVDHLAAATTGPEPKW